MQQDYATRLLCERDREREAADRLACAINRLFQKTEGGSLPAREILSPALMDYCIATGYNGPGGKWSKAIINYKRAQEMKLSVS